MSPYQAFRKLHQLTNAIDIASWLPRLKIKRFDLSYPFVIVAWHGEDNGCIIDGRQTGRYQFPSAVHEDMARC